MSRVWLVREKKPFAAWDLLVYGVLAVLIAVLFIVFVFSDAFGVKDARGIRVEAEGETVYTYLFGEGGQIAICRMPIAVSVKTARTCRRSGKAGA